MWAIFAIPAAGLSFFVSSWFTMLFWGILSPDLGIPTIGYGKSIVVTLGLWIVVAPLIAAVIRARAAMMLGAMRRRT